MMPLTVGEVAKSTVLWAVPLALVVATLVSIWLKDLTLAARRSRQMDAALKQGQFWSGWLDAISKARVLTDADKQRADEGLEIAAQSVDCVYKTRKKRSLSEFVEYRRNLPVWRRWFLLYAQPNSYSKFFQFLFVYEAFVIPFAWFARNTPYRYDRVDWTVCICMAAVCRFMASKSQESISKLASTNTE